MSKKFLFNFILTLTAVAVAVIWLLSIIMEDSVFGSFDILWVAAILAGVAGILFICRGLFSKNVTYLKKLNIIFGAGLIVIAFLAIINIIGNFDNKYVMPIIAIIGTVALLLCVIAVGGKKWDQGDNQNVGYKNYYERKKDEEKKNKQ